ncbi:MAG: tannase/feruloyl esterase family alpha/beta hydrolase [Candidatus Solibacter sp.]
MTPAPQLIFGCSDGGREALMEVQRYPEDFDGIIAGAPAKDWSHLFTGFVWNEKALTADPASAIPPTKLAARSPRRPLATPSTASRTA